MKRIFSARRLCAALILALVLVAFGGCSGYGGAGSDNAAVTEETSQKPFKADDWKRTVSSEDSTAPETSEEPKTSEPEESEETSEAEPAITEEAAAENAANGTTEAERDYVLNNNTMKFHYPSCNSVEDIQPHNREDFHGTRSEVINMGYEPCGRCKP